jgi:hypothetical protein
MSLSSLPKAPVSTEVLEPPIWPITVDQFGEMVRRGIIGEKDPVYLWKGRLALRIAPQRAHSLAVTLCHDALRQLKLPSCHVEQEQPLEFRFEESLPQPGLMVLKGMPRDFALRHPRTSDALLVVEVADSSIRFDRRAALDYAAEGVPVCWIVNLVERCVEVYSDPFEGAYRGREVVGADGELPVVIDGVKAVAIRVSALLP